MSCLYCTRKEPLAEGVYIYDKAIVIEREICAEGQTYKQIQRIAIDNCPRCGEALTKIEPYPYDDSVPAFCNKCGRQAPRGETIEFGRESVTMLKTETCVCQPKRVREPELAPVQPMRDMFNTIGAAVKSGALIGVERPSMRAVLGAAFYERDI